MNNYERGFNDVLKQAGVDTKLLLKQSFRSPYALGTDIKHMRGDSTIASAPPELHKSIKSVYGNNKPHQDPARLRDIYKDMGRREIANEPRYWRYNPLYRVPRALIRGIASRTVIR